MHLLTQAKNNVSALELTRHLGVCYRTVLTMKHKLMEVMRLREDSRQLDGRVQIDDAYLGGQRSGGKTGRGSENKVPFIAAVQTTPEGKPVLACFSQQPFTSEEVGIFAAKSFSSSASVLSDGLWCFRGVKIIGAEHEAIVTGGGKASVALPQFKAVNTVLSNLKTALSGTYHAFKFAKYAHLHHFDLFLSQHLNYKAPFLCGINRQRFCCKDQPTSLFDGSVSGYVKPMLYYASTQLFDWEFHFIYGIHTTFLTPNIPNLVAFGCQLVTHGHRVAYD